MGLEYVHVGSKILFSWRFISALFQNEHIFWRKCPAVSLRVVLTYFIIRNDFFPVKMAAMNFKRTCALNAILNEPARIYFTSGKFLFTWKSHTSQGWIVIPYFFCVRSKLLNFLLSAMNNKQIAISLQFFLLSMCVFYGPEYFSSQNYFLYMISDSSICTVR